MTEISDGPITYEEMIALFGNEMPIEAVQLAWSAPPEMTLAEIRRRLREIAAAKPKPAEISDGRIAEMVRESEAYMRNGFEWAVNHEKLALIRRLRRTEAELAEAREVVAELMAAREMPVDLDSLSGVSRTISAENRAWARASAFLGKETKNG